MVEYLPRSAWGARPAKSGPGLLTVDRVKGEVLHYPAMGARRLVEAADVAAALRDWQAYHMDGRGWSDIAYQVAVDQAGRAWTLRGLRTQSGANGNNAANEDYGAILLVIGDTEQPTAALIRTTQEVIRDARAIFPNAREIRPHSAVRLEYTGSGTSCPGDPARQLITAGAFEPAAIQAPSEDWFTMATPDEIKAAVADGVELGMGRYLSRFFRDESGTGDAIWDEARAFHKDVTDKLASIDGKLPQ